MNATAISTEKTTATFRIPEGNIEALRATFARIEKRARKLHVQAPTLAVGPEEVERTIAHKSLTGWTEGPGTDQRVIVKVFRTVTVSGETPRFPGGWRLAARIDHIEGSNILAKLPGAAELPASYRTDAPTCDHCGLSRKRRETFVCQDAAGKFVRVGRQCLANFLGARAENPELVCALFEMIAEACDAASAATGEGFGGGSGRVDAFDPTGVVAVAIAVVRSLGWVSSRAAVEGRQSTKAAVFDQLDKEWRSRHPSSVLPISDEDFATAEAARDWARATTGESDFDHNLRAVAGMEVIRGRYLGIAVYIPVAYAKAMGEAKSAAGVSRETSKPSDHFGTPGQRETFELTCTMIGTPRQTDYGTSTLVTFQDATGNVAKWWATKAFYGEEGEPVIGATAKWVATVKSHGSYNGRKETTLGRMSMAKEKAPKKPRAKKVATRKDEPATYGMVSDFMRQVNGMLSDDGERPEPEACAECSGHYGGGHKSTCSNAI